jgi:hypothetical protein
MLEGTNEWKIELIQEKSSRVEEEIWWEEKNKLWKLFIAVLSELRGHVLWTKTCFNCSIWIQQKISTYKMWLISYLKERNRERKEEEWEWVFVLLLCSRSFASLSWCAISSSKRLWRNVSLSIQMNFFDYFLDSFCLEYGDEFTKREKLCVYVCHTSLQIVEGDWIQWRTQQNDPSHFDCFVLRRRVV